MTRFLPLALLCVALPAAAQTIDFGDDSGDFALDAECDDRRFRGPGMARELSWVHLGRDATDCRDALEAGRISVWVFDDALAATDCSEIAFGDDSSEWAGDGECDDPRFEGMATARVLANEDRGRDASDCRRACEAGLLGLRDY